MNQFLSVGPQALDVEPVTTGLRKQNVFLIGLNDFNRAKLETVSNARDYNFFSLLDEPHDYDLAGQLQAATEQLAAFNGPIDAIVGYIDFPVSCMLPILGERFHVRTPTLEATLKCEHKYWSRLEQKKVVPDNIPEFAAVNPFDDEALANIPLKYPFWIKPVKSSGSYLGFRVNSPFELNQVIQRIRKGIGAVAEPFQFVLDRASLPPEVKVVDGHHCIVEDLISGRQCTLEGWVFNGEMNYHGIVDSVREPNGSSFSRYEYPSTIPRRVQTDMVEIARTVFAQIGFDNAAFNMEFRWNTRQDKIWLVEINARVAQHHSDLFEKVDGTTNHEVPIQISLSRKPRIAHGAGRFRHAATFFLRRYEDALVTHVPSPSTIADIQRRIPGTVIQLQVHPGMRLSELFEQDSYSYALAIIYVGAQNRKELLARYRSIVSELEFELLPEQQRRKSIPYSTHG